MPSVWARWSDAKAVQMNSHTHTHTKNPVWAPEWGGEMSQSSLFVWFSVIKQVDDTDFDDLG